MIALGPGVVPQAVLVPRHWSKTALLPPHRCGKRAAFSSQLAAAAASGDAGAVWHWSYGANLNQQVLASRDVHLLQAVAAVAPQDCAVSFRHRGGFATIVWLDELTVEPLAAAWEEGRPARGGDAAVPGALAACSIRQPHGMAYLLTRADLETLAKNETGYRLQQLLVTPYGGGKAIDAAVFVSELALRLPQALPPTQRYRRLLTEGAKQCGLDEDYIQQLEQLPTAAPGGLPPEYFETPSSGPAAAVAVLVLTMLLVAVSGLRC